jgi:hypothetical protein
MEEDFSQRILEDRMIIWIPFNVIMVAGIRGNVSRTELCFVVNLLRKKHPLLAVRIVKEDNSMYYITKGVGEIPVYEKDYRSESQWYEVAVEQIKQPFDIEVGPLVRFVLLHSSKYSDLIVCGHHSVCDGLSLVYLVHDILNLLSSVNKQITSVIIPPTVDRSMIPGLPALKLRQKVGIKLINSIWRRKKIRFELADYKRLHQAFWDDKKKQCCPSFFRQSFPEIDCRSSIKLS